MISVLKEMLENEKVAKAKAVKIYDDRIKNLRTAIINLENYNKVGNFINENPLDDLKTIEE